MPNIESVSPVDVSLGDVIASSFSVELVVEAIAQRVTDGVYEFYCSDADDYWGRGDGSLLIVHPQMTVELVVMTDDEKAYEAYIDFRCHQWKSFEAPDEDEWDISPCGHHASEFGERENHS